MINLRGMLVVVLAVAAFTMVSANAARRVPRTDFCKMVRQAAKTYGADTVEMMARSSGASEADIASAKRCLK